MPGSELRIYVLYFTVRKNPEGAEVINDPLTQTKKGAFLASQQVTGGASPCGRVAQLSRAGLSAKYPAI